MEIHEWIVDINNWIMDIHEPIMSSHYSDQVLIMTLHGAIMELRKTFVDLNESNYATP